MNKNDLISELNSELALIKKVVDEIEKVMIDLKDAEPTTVEITAMASFATQFYMGIENCLKRISKFNNIPLINSFDWHIKLFNQFCEPPLHPLPALFDENLKYKFTLIRKFRHYFLHGYSFTLEWDWVKSGIAEISSLYYSFYNNIHNYIKTL